ncbi:C40 family peptidase [Actinomycetospora endophytica]|uniref:C40 family peptidase n=1 Tax=Actinomycetospora endophytica TaxID=2291215 RepID=A0ABS8PFR9_9PSEU|nr:C40 family peptidase [Actinomycetospora endophytica]MCD2196256.1 C40 family peptidase [Actinomycetospora endophytica]
MSLPSSLTDGTLTRAGIAAALVTASAAAVAGSTGAFAAVGNADVSHAATNMSYAPAAAHTSLPTQHASVTPIAASAPSAAPAVKHTSPAAETAKKAAADQASAAKAAAQKAAAQKAASAKQASAAASLGAMGDRIVNTASGFAGTPYVWGATGPDSFDCSGFTQYVFKKMGISLPRTAQQQYDAADHISKSQAQPGDLVFIGSPGDIYHVAIYAGNNKIWTAPEPGQSVKLGNIFGDASYGRMR